MRQHRREVCPIFIFCVKHLNNKSFDKALKIINSIAHKYQDDQIILKMFASIYFNKLEWEKAITYYKKILTFEKHPILILVNLDVKKSPFLPSFRDQNSNSGEVLVF